MKNRGGYLVKRIFAFGFDFFITDRLALLFGTFIYRIISGELNHRFMEDFGHSWILLLSIFLSSTLTYIIIPHYSQRNQTIMQRVFRLEVVTMDGNKPDLMVSIKRFLIACVLEGWFYSLPAMVITYISIQIFGNQTVQSGLGMVMIIVGLVSVGFALKDKEHSRMLHDYFSATKVVELPEVSQKGKRVL